MTVSLRDRYVRVRNTSSRLAGPLSDADMTLQVADFASPTKWHLAHTTWFFEEFVLAGNARAYRRFHPDYAFLFNSYYEGAGQRQPRHLRGMLSRPALEEIAAYRAHVDGHMDELLRRDGDLPSPLVELGLQHERQHQELILTDIQLTLWHNPLRPRYRLNQPPWERPAAGYPAVAWQDCPGGLVTIGHRGEAFSFDNEGPAHQTWLSPYRLARQLVTNGEWLAFMADGGYARPDHWLSDGWRAVQVQGWHAPLYWEQRDGQWHRFGLDGWATVDLDDPVCHISYFEADAFARWRGKRLPTEFEWEAAATGQPLQGSFLEGGRLAPSRGQGELAGLYGEVWQWTASPYIAYPGYAPLAGVVGEYNGKFMNGQYVLRGASCVTSQDHARPTYRNFFPPDQRWQFCGMRLADKP